ncbi:MAG: hypothetical protein O2890_06205 [Cyanobacteria bacterium]|nr:hypothetical protein [Cyanobacteriota bacterium]
MREATGCDRAVISKVENGHRCTLSYLRAVVEAFPENPKAKELGELLPPKKQRLVEVSDRSIQNLRQNRMKVLVMRQNGSESEIEVVGEATAKAAITPDDQPVWMLTQPGILLGELFHAEEDTSGQWRGFYDPGLFILKMPITTESQSGDGQGPVLDHRPLEPAPDSQP